MTAINQDEAAPVEKKSRSGGALGTMLLIVPKIPLVLRVILLHILRLSPEAKHQDLRTEVTVKLLRAFISPSKPRPVSEIQKLTGGDPGIKGRIWVSKYTAPAPPEDNLLEALGRAIQGLGKVESLTLPDLVPVEAEWTGYRKGATEDSKPPRISESEKYHELMKDVTSATTVLYCHGGGYYLMDPATHRPTTKKLAKLTGGRCYSIRYRLAPQHPFPAALLDALVSYLTLLYPPPGAFHEAVRPEDIVFAGDSAGGNLVLVLLQTILELRRQNVKIVWQGESRELPVPAGIAVNSPWTDITHSSPSCETMTRWDYLPGRSYLSNEVPPCPAWPANPPRATLYAPDALIAHPLVAPVLASSWQDAPPLYVCTGWEMLADEGKSVATQFVADGVPVVHEEYEAMPHCFGIVLNNTPVAKRNFAGWAGFIRQVVEKPDTVATRFTVIKARTLEEETVEPSAVKPYTREEIESTIRNWVTMRTTPSGEVSKL